MKKLLIISLAVLIICMGMGCISTDSDGNTVVSVGDTPLIEVKETPVVIERNVITEDAVIGAWRNTKNGTRLFFADDGTYHVLVAGRCYLGEWEIKNNATIYMYMESWEETYYGGYGEYMGVVKVSYGTITDNVLECSAVNVVEGYPHGEYVPC